MTPTQHYFPYFFHLDTFNKEIKTFGLSSSLKINNKTHIPDTLSISKNDSQEAVLTIPFGATLMIDGDKLLYWTTDYDTLDITQAQLIQLENSTSLLNKKIDLTSLSLGHNKMEADLHLNNFVTYVRKENLKYEQDYYEKFVIVIIKNHDINIIPFDWFNKTGGDYGYVWPATARLDNINCKIYGQGMRMSDFTIDLVKACI